MLAQKGNIINHLKVILTFYYLHLDFRRISGKYLFWCHTVRYLVLLYIILITSKVPAQIPASFSGPIKDECSEVIPGISLVLQGTQKGAITNRQGRFFIANILPGNYAVEILRVSNKKQWFSLFFQAGKQIKRSIILKENTSELDEVIVTSKSKAQVLQLSARSVQAIKTQEIKLKSADLGKVLAQPEGVTGQCAGGLGSGIGFPLNGLSGDQIRFSYNDILLNFTPYAFGIARLPMHIINGVEIYKGVVPIQFGADALDETVNLASFEIENRLTGSVSYLAGSFNTQRITGNINPANEKNRLFAMAGGFYDYTDNNYKIDVAIPDAQGQLKQRTVRRFHAGYRAYGANFRIGLRNKKWANELSLEGYYGDYAYDRFCNSFTILHLQSQSSLFYNPDLQGFNPRNEIQNSQAPGLIDQFNLGIERAVARSPFEEVVFTNFSTGFNLSYNVHLNSNWKLDLMTGYNYNKQVSIDAARNLYNWSGEVMRVQNQPGEFGEASYLITISESLFDSQQLNYMISNRHVLKLSLAPAYTYRIGDNLLIPGEFDQALDDEFLFDLVTRLVDTTNLLNKQLQVIAFVKNYRQNIRIESFYQRVKETLIDERAVSNYDVGNRLRYNWSPYFSTKLNYEFAYWLSLQDEIFEDDQLIFENLEPQPESNHNLNLQWVYSNKENASTHWPLRGNFFIYRINDLILLLVGADDFGSFQNIRSTSLRCFELSERWKGFTESLTIPSNAAFEQYLNTSETGLFKSFEGDRIHNIPYLFFDEATENELTNTCKKQDKLSIFWNIRYVSSFFVGWESAGLQQFKSEVPNQTIHAVGLTHRMNNRNIPNALALKVQNLIYAKVFNLFGAQRHGEVFLSKKPFNSKQNINESNKHKS
ncbi:MAG: carboxypeptidase-like regulatory domain-containing protein [Bacteroidota bacterium]